MKRILLILFTSLFAGWTLMSNAKDADSRIIKMQMNFIECVQANDSDGAYAITDSLKSLALKENRLQTYYFCYTNLIKMECIRGKYPEALKIVEDMHKDIEMRGNYDYIPDYYKALATIHSSRGDKKAALDYLLKADKNSKKTDCNIYVRLATLLISMDKPEEAVAWADKAQQLTESEIIMNNAMFYKMHAYFNMEKKDSFDIYHEKFVSSEDSLKQPDLIPYAAFMKYYMDGNYTKAIACSDSIVNEEDRLRFLVLAYHKSGNLEAAYKIQKKLIKREDSIREMIVHDDLNAMMHSMELAATNNKLAQQKNTNIILVVVIAVIVVIASTILNITRYRYTKKLKQQNLALTEALGEVKKSKRIRRAMIEDVKEKSQQPTDILRTYSKAIITPDFNLAIDGDSKILNNIRKSTEKIKALLDPVANMYQSDEQAQKTAVNGNTHIDNSKAVLIDTINSLLGFIDIIESAHYNLPEEEKQNVLDQMHVDMKDIAIMFDTLLDMAYYDSYDKLPTNDYISVNELCHTVINEFIQRHKDNVSLHFDTSIDDNVCTKSDYTALYKMIRYTLDNADKFTAEGSIHVSCTMNNGKAVISITDTGCGIKKEERNMVFDRFFKAENQHSGIGLSLPICRRIGSLINCSIALDESYEKGCKFDITIQNIA